MQGQDHAGVPVPRLLSIQLLRALAALCVALAHLTYGFADHVGQGLGIDQGRPVADWLAQVAVVLFFTVSGFVMVVSSRRLFGTADGTRRFLVNRAVRVLPPYWIATLLFLFAANQSAAGWSDIIRSFLLIPYWTSGQPLPLPLLWPGWTLFFELVFYLLFGLGVSRGRKWACVIPAVMIGLLTLAGLFWQPQDAGLFMLTRPVMLAFVWGLLLGTLHERGRRLPAGLRAAMLVGALALVVVVPDTPEAHWLGLAYMGWAGLPAMALFAAVAGGDWLGRAQGRIAQLADLAGNVSFALYLLHVPLAHLWTTFYPGRLYALGPWFFLLGLVGFALASSALFWRFVERPLTRWLRTRLLGT